MDGLRDIYGLYLPLRFGCGFDFGRYRYNAFRLRATPLLSFHLPHRYLIQDSTGWEISHHATIRLKQNDYETERIKMGNHQQ